MTWVILIFNAIMVAWIIGGVASTHASNCGQLSQQVCNDAANTGKGIAVVALVVLWLVGDAILGVIWMVTKGRSCPVCGRSVRKGLVACNKCGHDFRTTAVGVS